jgi:hypothetical protein
VFSETCSFWTGATLCKTTEKDAVKMGGFDFKLGGWRFFGRFFSGRFLTAGGTAALALVFSYFLRK